MSYETFETTGSDFSPWIAPDLADIDPSEVEQVFTKGITEEQNTPDEDCEPFETQSYYSVYLRYRLNAKDGCGHTDCVADFPTAMDAAYFASKLARRFHVEFTDSRAQ